MRLMRNSEVPVRPEDLVFRVSRLNAIVLVSASLGICAFLIFYNWPHPRVAYAFASGILLFLYFLHRFATARFLPSNWLLRLSDEGLHIHFRSYLNYHLAAEDPTVFFLSYGDIRSARLIKERLQTPDPMQPNRPTTQFKRWIELELALDTSAVSEGLNVERGRPGVWEKHWYGRSATLYRDYPVLMQTSPFLRVQWSITLPASELLDALQQKGVGIQPTVKTTEDFSSLQGLSREQQEKRLRELDQRGQRITAIYLARKLYQLDLTEATQFMNSLAGESKQ